MDPCTARLINTINTTIRVLEDHREIPYGIRLMCVNEQQYSVSYTLSKSDTESINGYFATDMVIPREQILNIVLDTISQLAFKNISEPMLGSVAKELFRKYSNLIEY